nr:serine--tRNA ligase [bacterium]
PFVVNRSAMTATAQLPKMEDDMYRLEADDLFLIPTAEVPVTNIHREEILPGESLPVRYVAYSPCFRREAGSYGKETRGLIRLHQFDKVELVAVVEPGASGDEHARLLGCCEEVVRRLELPYRILELPTGDLSFAAARCYDIEIWAPGQGEWLECSSVSNFEDFQARRARIRYRDAAGAVGHPHTLNGSGVALPRTIVAVLENFQEADGSVTVPEALRPYLGGIRRLEA